MTCLCSLGLLVVSAQGNGTISGTVYATPGGSLQGAVVIACLVENDTCSDSRSGAQPINSNAASASFEITNLETAEHLMLAWRDLNNNGEADAGDEIGVYRQGGKPALLTPPAAGIELRLQAFNGDLDALVSQAEGHSGRVASPPVSPQPISPQTVSPQPVQSPANLSLSGRVTSQPGSSLLGTQVFAAIFANDTFDTKRTKGVTVGANGAFTLLNLEKTRYALFAWRDTSKDGKIGAGDEMGVYLVSGKVSPVTPSQTNLTLTLKPYSSAGFDAMRDLFLPNNSVSSNTTPNFGSSSPASNAGLGNTVLTYTIPKSWRDTGNGNYEADFGKDDSIYRKGRLDLQIFPPRAKVGGLATQTRAIWQQETRGSLDFQGQKGAVFVRRTASGLNVGVTFGTAGSFDNSAHDKDFPKLSNYSVLFVIETAAVVTPIFFKLSRPESGLGYITYEKEGRPLMLEFMRGVKSLKPVTVTPLYVEKDFVGKWKETSGTYNATDWYNPSGTYATSTWVSTGFTLKLGFNAGGVGTYFAQLTTVNTGAFNTQTENETMKWRINGDQIVIERPKSGRKSLYQVFARGKDAQGNTVFLTDLMYSNQTVTDLDASPENTWVVDR